MRDIYETAKKAQMAPVRGRVKAMMAQPRAVAQARKVARQTTGFQAGGKVSTPMTHDSDFTRWFESQYGGTEKGKPHSTLEGRSAAGRRYMRRAEKYWTKRREEEKKRKDDPHHPKAKLRPGPMGRPGAPSPGGRQGLPKPKKKEEEGMYVKKGGVMNYKKGGKVDKKWIQKAVNPKHKGYCTPMSKPTCTPRRKALAKLFKSKAKKGWKQGGSLPYLARGISRPGVYKAPRGKHHMAELLAGKTSKLKMPKKASGKKLAAVAGVGAIGAETYRQKTKKKKKSVEESLIEKIKKKANGGTVVMPTVGNDVRTRAYKHGALIHPRPKPTTVAHGRGVGIAKRGW